MEYVRVCLYEVCVCMFLCIQVTTRIQRNFIYLYTCMFLLYVTLVYAHILCINRHLDTH